MEVRPEDIEHPGLQQLLAGLYRLHDDGEPPNIDGLRELIENPALIDWAIDEQEVGLEIARTGPVVPGRARIGFATEQRSWQRKQLMDRLRAATDG